MTGKEDQRINNPAMLLAVCSGIEKLSDSDLDRLCLMIEGELLARKEKAKYENKS